MTSATATTHFRLAIPVTWTRLELAPATRTASIERLVAERGRAAVDGGVPREDLVALLDGLAARAVAGRGVYAAFFSDVFDGRSVSASLLVSVLSLEPLPSTISDRAPRPGDERLSSVTGRRPVVEAVVAAAAAAQPGVSLRRGTAVAGLLPGRSAIPGVPHVAGVRTTRGEEIAADLVVDATGRCTAAATWLVELGACPPHVESEDSGFAYYTRYFTGPVRACSRRRCAHAAGQHLPHHDRGRQRHVVRDRTGG